MRCTPEISRAQYLTSQGKLKGIWRDPLYTVQKFKGHTSRVWGVIHLPGGQRIVTCSSDGSLRVWDLKSGEQIGERWRDGVSPVYTIALSPDGTKVVSGSEDGAVRLWSIETGKVIAKWTGHTQGVCSVCWSQDGRRVLSGRLFAGRDHDRDCWIPRRRVSSKNLGRKDRKAGHNSQRTHTFCELPGLGR
ncbi:WD40-repeat-containing domain protein [Suillus lakei]|nr:WD40-repeat-containing domain protein [Suillus lakei]